MLHINLALNIAGSLQTEVGRRAGQQEDQKSSRLALFQIMISMFTPAQHFIIANKIEFSYGQELFKMISLSPLEQSRTVEASRPSHSSRNL
jgi:hypothetical protein